METNVTIYKYPFIVSDATMVEMPEGAEVIHVGLDPQRRSCFWARVDPSKPLVQRVFFVVGTGHPMSPKITAEMHVGSFNDYPFVWHIFDLEVS